jgi:hypothetical protein
MKPRWVVSEGACVSLTDGPFEPDLDAWEAWRPEEAARRLTGVEAPWYVAGGWALDLFLGGQRREHEDLEIGVPRERFGEFAAALGDVDLFVAGSDGLWPLTETAMATHHQTWVRERATGKWRLDIFREQSEGDTWICRRDDRIRMPYRDLIRRSSEGIPFARPEVILLFKAKVARPKDEDDLAAVLPHLSEAARQWMIEALEMVHPGHAWMERVRSVG